MMLDIPARLAIQSRDHVGEGPVWDARQKRLLWGDHATGAVHEARAGDDGWRETRRWELGRGLAAAIPREAGGLIVTSGVEALLMDDDGRLAPFARLEADPAKEIMNDAKCDRRGRLWVGTRASDFSPSAGLYRIDPDGGVRTMLDGLRLSNGLDWSPDGSIFYLIDSLELSVDAFDFDPERGEIANRRRLVRLDWGGGAANGMTVDGEGCLWVAVTGGGEVRRYTPGGELIGRIAIGVPGATSCAFGGSDLDVLFITSRSGRMPEIASTVLGIPEDRLESNEPEAGGLWACRPGARGLPAARFGG